MILAIQADRGEPFFFTFEQPENSKFWSHVLAAIALGGLENKPEQGGLGGRRVIVSYCNFGVDVQKNTALCTNSDILCAWRCISLALRLLAILTTFFCRADETFMKSGGRPNFKCTREKPCLHSMQSGGKHCEKVRGNALEAMPFPPALAYQWAGCLMRDVCARRRG